ncbi:hypothetical protein ASPZODRAFT_56728 [Penicilliopsis zonata CBS 506.65]|uniref:Cell pattern formation-associated protein stuA n=1 Tax=Penicilliopsis zonata CBS 506.65 TaxID=1073090 RepID=A0A1L9SUL1_9EURO|nr:hypothetical protein ASPZODRAFT_56728 [Penicilliopsis zonata CBS 506.65]OJJ50888.1 hypothetical protein ASPZODRAFT_56728 [Penicilliopsis zonata CBS 506.65]
MMRSLPKRLNPLILSDTAPPYEELLASRRLGKTHLAVKPAQVGTSNATKPENLGPFEYAHLRAPLPKDLKGSEIFPSHAQPPETYFLMRRSKDGFVSATGMFKIAFPWAKLEEERSEREYLKSRNETSEDEIAGNVWISPVLALDLAKDYGMHDWVRALLDPTEIVQSPSNAKKQITPPPKFDLPPLEAPELAPAPTLRRSRRSASPSKKPVSPRKPRQTRAAKETAAASTSATNSDLQSALESSAAASGKANGKLDVIDETKAEEAAEDEGVKSKSKKTAEKTAATAEPVEAKEEGEKVKVDVESTVEATGDVETTKTTVSVEMPISLPDLPSAADTEQMIAKAKEMVEEARKLQQGEEDTAEASTSPKAAKKRKQEEVAEEDGEEPSDLPVQRAKKARVLEEKLKRERVRNRALVGVTATLALA